MAIVVKLNRRGMDALLNDPGIHAYLTPIAERVADTARASAPVATGAYRDSIGVEAGSTDRSVVRVVAGARHALLVESRTGNLSRALGSA